MYGNLPEKPCLDAVLQWRECPGTLEARAAHWSGSGGGLMRYGPSHAGSDFRAATHVDKIFKGAKPQDLPVEQPTLFKLTVNQTTAKALGLAIPYELMLRAEKVIE